MRTRPRPPIRPCGTSAPYSHSSALATCLRCARRNLREPARRVSRLRPLSSRARDGIHEVRATSIRYAPPIPSRDERASPHPPLPCALPVLAAPRGFPLTCIRFVACRAHIWRGSALLATMVAWLSALRHHNATIAAMLGADDDTGTRLDRSCSGWVSAPSACTVLSVHRRRARRPRARRPRALRRSAPRRRARPVVIAFRPPSPRPQASRSP